MSLWKASLPGSRGGSLGGLVADLLRRPWMTLGAEQRLDEAKANVRLDAAGLAGLQAARLRRLLWRCFLDVPAYRDRWQGRLLPSRLDEATDLEVLRGLPMPALAERAVAPRTFVAVDAVPVEVARWTPGPPVWADVESLARRDAVRRRAEGGPALTVWGTETDLAPRALSAHECTSLLHHRGALSLPGSTAGELVAAGAVRAAVLVVRGAADRLAYGGELRRLVTAPEVGLVAATCRSGQLHVPADHLVVEIVNDHDVTVPHGADGWVCVTDLGNHAAPYLRHRLPRRARLGSPCGCGLAFPTLQLTDESVPR